jgi:hypothetical protein
MTKTLTMRIMLVTAAMFITVTGASFAQVSFQVGAGVGYAIPSSDFSGTPAEYYAGTNYGLASGLNFHAKARIGLVGFNITGEASYSMFSNEGDAEPGKAMETKKRILALKVGPEFRLGLPAVPVSPYIGLNVALNMFSGSTTFQGLTSVPSGTHDLTGASRIGAGGTVGVLLNLAGTNLDVAFHYNIHNLTGAAWEGADNRIDTYTGLNDDKDPAYAVGNNKHVVSEARSIHSMVLSVSILFGF